MRHPSIEMKVIVLKSMLLATLEDNRSKHAKIVQEARAGYVEQARERLKAKLDELAAGKLAALSFGLQVPQDYTRTYDTAIGMLKMHTGEQIELAAGEYQNLVEDDWDWTQNFLHLNKAYSSTATAEADKRGY